MSFTDRLLLWLHVAFAIFTLGPVVAAMMATARYIRKRDLAVLRYLYRTTRIFGLLTVGVFLFGLILGRHDFNHAWFSAAMTLFIVAAVLLVLVVFDQRRAITAIDKALAVDDARAKAQVPTNTGAAPARTAAAPATTAAAPSSTAAVPDQREGESTRPGSAEAAAGPAAAGATSGRQSGTNRADEPAADAPAAGEPARDQSAATGQRAQAGEPTETAAAPRPAVAGASGAGAAHLASVERGRIVTMGSVITAIWLVILVLMVWNG